MEGISFVTDMLRIKLMLQFDIVTTEPSDSMPERCNYFEVCKLRHFTASLGYIILMRS